MTMLVHICYAGWLYVIEAPAGARVVLTSGEDCLVYQWSGRREYLPTPFAVLSARDGAQGLRLISQTPTSPLA
jgi:hypothetical protein